MYLRARWYDASTGRFTQKDPLAIEHSYVYAVNTPINRIDPTGYFSEETIKNSLAFGSTSGLFGVWGGLETLWRPNYSGLLMVLKKAAPGDQLRSGRLNWTGRKLEVRWDSQWTFDMTDTCPAQIKLSRNNLLGSHERSLAEHVMKLSAFGQSAYLGGYIYHEHIIVGSGRKDVYRDGASTLVPDLLNFDVSLPAEPIPILDLKVGPKLRGSVDRFGNLYISSKIAVGGLSIGPSLSPVKGASSAVYLGGSYGSPAHVAESQRRIPTEREIIGAWADGGIKSSAWFGDSVSYQFGPIGAYYGGKNDPYTMFTISMMQPLRFGVGAGHRGTVRVGNFFPAWDNIDSFTPGVSWGEAISTPDHCAGTECGCP